MEVRGPGFLHGEHLERLERSEAVERLEPLERSKTVELLERSEAVERLERLELALSFCESAGPTPGRFPSSPLLFNPEEQRPKGIVNIPPMTD